MHVVLFDCVWDSSHDPTVPLTGCCRLYHITLWTFVLALGHFLSEAFIYKTAPLTIGVMAPLIVASESKNTLRTETMKHDPGISFQVQLKYLDEVLAAPFPGFSVIGMLIGFQCFPESEEEVGARQKKRNWKLNAGFSSCAMNPCPLWPPEWDGKLTDVMGETSQGASCRLLFLRTSRRKVLRSGSLTSAARNLCNI